LSQGALAQARVVHIPAGSFGSEGSGPGQLTVPMGIAVNDITPNVYVVDQGNNRVEEFSAAGVFITEFDGSASPSGAFSEPTHIAVDNSDNPLDPSAGDVYVVDEGRGRHVGPVIDKFTESGVYVGQITGTPNGEFSKYNLQTMEVAVDSAGKLWVLEDEITQVDVFSDALENEYLSGEVLHAKSGSDFGNYGDEGFAVDSEGGFYLGGDIEFDSAGKIVNEFGISKNSSAMAVDDAHKELYVDYETGIVAFSLSGELLD
jgi:DNA-binding beta-propeller fold protein YncE